MNKTWYCYVVIWLINFCLIYSKDAKECKGVEVHETKKEAFKRELLCKCDKDIRPKNASNNGITQIEGFYVTPGFLQLVRYSFPTSASMTTFIFEYFFFFRPINNFFVINLLIG